MRAAFIAALLLAGCVSKAWPIQGITAEAQDRHRLAVHNTTQPCQHGGAAVATADLAIPIALSVYRAAGYCKAYEVDLYGKLQVCVIEQPEPCEPLPWPRHGCATMYAIQQSNRWPPLCEPGMPAALRCVETPAAQRTGWRRNFVHEITNALLWRCGIYDPSYQHPSRKLEPEIWTKVQAAREGKE